MMVVWEAGLTWDASFETDILSWFGQIYTALTYLHTV